MHCLASAPRKFLLQTVSAVYISTKEIVFTCVCVCQPDYSKAADEIFMKFTEWLDIILEPVDWILSDLDPRPTSLEVRRLKSFFFK